MKRGYEIKPGSSLKEEIMAREAADCQGILVRTAPITEKIMKAGKDVYKRQAQREYTPAERL